MKTAFLKRFLSVTLALLLVISALPMMANEADAAAYTGIMRQTESQWLNYSFNGGTLYATGCGIFSLANAVGYLTGEKMDVVEIATWAHNNGMYNVTGADGTYRTSFYQRASARYGETYGFTIDCSSDGGGYWSTAGDSRLKNHLSNGGTAVIHVYNHFMALVGYDASTNKFHLYDCAPRDRRGTLGNGGDLWFTEAQLSSGYTDIDWFCLVSPTVKDEEKPVISNLVYSNVSASGYTVSCTVTDNMGVSKVAFPTWTLKNGQDDLAADFLNTQLGTKNGNTYSFRVNTSDHNNETGSYATHIYAFDRAGNMSKLEPTHIQVRNDTQNPVISDVVYSDVSTSGYTVSCKVTDDWGVHSVSFPTWTIKNGQDDLPEQFLTTQLGTKDGDRYTFRVKAADHNNETGTYVTHIYATDCAGNRVSLPLSNVEVRNDTTNPVISDAVISNVTAAGYTVTCKVTDDWGVNTVAFPTWTHNNGQDDLPDQFMKTQVGTKNGDIYTFQVKASDHNNETGFYTTHIYAKDCAGNTVSLVLDAVEVKDAPVVEPEDPPVVEPEDPPVVEPSLGQITLTTSSTYAIDEKMVNNIEEGTSVSNLLKQFENETLEVVDGKGAVISGSAIVGTGAQINLYKNDELIDSVTVVILGDVDGNGIVDTTDVVRVKAAFLGTFTLSDAETLAADVDKSGVIDTTDYMRVKSHFLGTYDLYA